MHNGGAISSHGFLLDDIDELEGAAERGVRVWPFGALKVSHLQNIIILMRAEEDVSHISFMSKRNILSDALLLFFFYKYNAVLQMYSRCFYFSQILIRKLQKDSGCLDITFIFTKGSEYFFMNGKLD